MTKIFSEQESSVPEAGKTGVGKGPGQDDYNIYVNRETIEQMAVAPGPRPFFLFEPENIKIKTWPGKMYMLQTCNDK